MKSKLLLALLAITLTGTAAAQLKPDDAIKASFDIPAAAISIPNARFTEQSWSASAGVDVGVLFPVSDNFSITAQAGLRYIAKLDGDDRDIGGLGLSSINDDAKRLSVPVSISARWDF